MAQPTQKRLADQLEKPEQVAGNVGHAGSGTGPEYGPNDQDHEDDHVHHVAMPTYYAVFALLMVLLFITVGAWWIDQHYYPLGALSTPIAMAIAVAKAVAIVLIFMHVKFASRLVQIFACTGVAFVSIMFLLTLQDYVARDLMPLPKAGVAPAGSVPHLRVDSAGSAPNDQSTPADNMMPANAGGMSSTGARSMSSVNIAGTYGGNVITPVNGSAVRGTTVTVSPNADDTRPGAIIGGAANNSFGSQAQSRGIEPSRAGATAPQTPATAAR